MYSAMICLRSTTVELAALLLWTVAHINGMDHMVQLADSKAFVQLLYSLQIEISWTRIMNIVGNSRKSKNKYLKKKTIKIK